MSVCAWNFKRNLGADILSGFIAHIFAKACTKKGAAKYGQTLGLTSGWESEDLIDLYVVGAVAVTSEGVRLGKGLGYAEMEWAMLHQLKRFARFTSDKKP